MEKCDEDSYEAILEEIEALKAIFCNPDEFFLISSPNMGSSRDPSASFKINLRCSLLKKDDKLSAVELSSFGYFTVEVNVVLPLQYPAVLPRVSLSCTEISKANLQTLRSKLYDYAGSLPQGPKIMEVAMWIQQQACYYRTALSFSKSISVEDQKGNKTPRSVVLSRLDHMRNRTRYVKFLCSWAQELGIKGSLFFAGYLILVLLEGTQRDVKEYLRRHRSCNVDVDSGGKPCKERMMTILTQEERHPGLELPDFGVVECSSYSDLEEHFRRMDLHSLYEASVKHILS